MRQLLLFTLLLILIVSSSVGQSEEIVSTPYRTYTREQGLSGNEVTALLQDSYGYLWVGTSEGLNRFDGKDFIQFHHDSSDPESSLSGNSVRAIYEFDEKIFICTHRGISIFDLTLNSFTNTLIADILCNYTSKDPINFIYKKNENYYVGGESTLLQLDRDFKTQRNFMLEMTNSGDPLHRDFLEPIELDKNHLFFPNCSKGIILDLTTFMLTSAYPGENSHNFSINSSCQTASYKIENSDQIVVASWGSDPVVLQNGIIIREIPLKKILDIEVISTVDFLQVKPEILWIATDLGLCEYNLNSFECRKLNPAKERTGFRCLLKDNEGLIWVGSELGLSQYPQSPGGFGIIDLKQYSTYQKETNVHDFGIIDDQLLLNLQIDSGMRILTWKNQKLDVLIAIQNNSGIRSLNPLGEDTLLVGFWEGMALYSMKEKKVLSSSILPPELKNKIVLGAIKDNYNQLWIALGANAGIYKHDLNTNQGTHYSFEKTGPFHFPIASAYDLTMDTKGTIYFVRSKLDGKLVKWNQEKQLFEVIKPTNNTTARFEGESYCIEKDIFGNIWYAVVREGLFCYNPVQNTIKHFDTNTGLLSNNIFAIECDKYGNVWLGTSSGIDVFQTNNDNFIHFTQTDGLPLGSFEPVSAYYNDTLFFSAGGKLIYFEPTELLNRSPKPKTYIYQIAVNDNWIKKDITTFEHDENYFEFHFTSVDLTYGKDFLYRYRLLGLDQEWRNSGELKTAVYGNVPAGEYSFEVSVLIDGKWNDGMATYSFTVQKPFWLTWWFLLFTGLIAIGIIYIIMRSRIQRIKEIELMRSNISRDLHDDIGSGLSSIRIISSNIKSIDTHKAIESLEKIQSRSQNMLDKMDDIIWAINPREDKGATLLVRMREHAAELVEAAGIELSIDLDPSLETVHFTMGQKSHLFLIFKESLNNAIKYSRCNQIQISFRKVGSKGILSVCDNGVGFDSKINLQGNGLKNMSERAHELKGEINLNTAPSKGTTITLIFEL